MREQSEVVGHAVRAMYLYSAMADLAGEVGDAELLAACRRLWDDLCLKKMYLTGGIGPSKHNEGFTTAYDLPNDTAYAETCAAIGLVFWNHRLLQLDCDGRYADVLERALYNGALSGVSLDGEKFFYDNPLASKGSASPRGLVRLRLLPAEHRAPAGLARELFLFAERRWRWRCISTRRATVTTTLADGTPLTVRQQTQYPWDGTVRLTLEMPAAATCTFAPAHPRLVPAVCALAEWPADRGTGGKRAMPC